MGRPRIYTLNENYFEDIDSSDKSYILGFLYADGSISKNCLSIGISYKDIEIIDFITKELNFNGGYKIYSLNGNEYVRISITSKKLISDLIKLGIVRNKTYESKEKMRKEKQYKYDGELNPFYGKKHTDETKEKMRKKSLGKKLTDEIKNKISNSLKGKHDGTNNPSSIVYQVLTPNGKIIECNGRDELKKVTQINIRKLIKEKEYLDYKLINKIKRSERMARALELLKK